MNEELNSIVPKTNVEIYRYIYLIEVSLRELFIAEFSKISGPTWYKTHLPADILQSFQQSRKKELAEPWSSTVPLHPMYYTDFGDLVKIIERKGNWKNVFCGTFGNSKEVPIGDLKRLANIRNKVAHNRKATEADANIALGVYQSFHEALGERFATLVANCTFAESIPETLTSLRNEMTDSFTQCEKMEVLSELVFWPKTSTTWWFNETYLNTDLSPVTAFFDETLQSYMKLNRTRGAGFLIERWLAANKPKIQYEAAKSCIDKLLGQTL